MAGKPDKLALAGGRPVITAWPKRRLFGQAEKKAVMRLFDRAIASGEAFGYNGPEEEAYCREFAESLGGGFADAVNSGTSAIYVALRALEIPAFSEVVCPPITDPGGAMPVPLCNCIPVPADAAPGSFNAGPDQIEARVTSRTRGIIVAHIAGIPVEMGPVMEIARARGIPVIEDCAQAHAARYRGRCVGTFGTIGAFSTMSGKHHATGAQGGVVFTKDQDLYWRIRRHSDRGKPFGLAGASRKGDPKRERSRLGTHVECGLNFNLNDLSACIGRVQLKRLPKIVAARQRTADMLAGACRRELKAVRIVQGPPRSEPSCWFLFGQLDLDRLGVDKAGFVKALAAEGVPAWPSYLHIFSEHEWYRNRAVFPGTTYPWGCPLYKGDGDRDYPLPNIRQTDRYTFPIAWHERVSAGDVRKVLAALKKVEKAYLK